MCKVTKNDVSGNCISGNRVSEGPPGPILNEKNVILVQKSNMYHFFTQIKLRTENMKEHVTKNK